MFGYSKEKLNCFINDIEYEIAFVTVTDSVGEKSEMEISLEDLKDNSIECKIGTFFSFTLKCLWGWEKCILAPVKKKIILKKKLKEL